MQAKLDAYQAKDVECITLQGETFEDRRVTQSCFGEVSASQAKIFLNWPVQTTSTLNVVNVGDSPKTTGIRQCHKPEDDIVLCLDTHRRGGQVLAPQEVFALALEGPP